MYRRWNILGVVIVCSALGALAWWYVGRDAIYGIVTDGRNRMPNARVRIKTTDIFTDSNDKGEFTLQLPAGRDSVVVTAWAANHYIGVGMARRDGRTLLLRVIPFPETDNEDYQWIPSHPNLEQEKAESIPLNVYETTDRDEYIGIKMHHIFLESGGPPFDIREALVVENSGNRTYVGSKEVQPGKRETLRISLPEKATGLQFMQPSIVNTEGGFSDTKEIKPGTKNIIFSYRINPEKSNYTFKKKIDLKTDNLRFIFPDAGMSARSDQLELQKPIANGEHRFLYLSGKDLSKGSQVLVTLSFPGGPVGKNIFKGVIIGLAILLVGAGFVFSYRKRRNNGKNEGSPESEGLDLSVERKTLLQTIADLDERYESGAIDAESYHAKRSEYLKKAKEISQEIQGDTLIESKLE